MAYATGLHERFGEGDFPLPTSLYIDGALVAGATSLPVENPATGQIFCEVASADTAQFEAAIGAARRSFDAGTWSDLPARERATILNRLIDELIRRKDLISRILVEEAGAPVSSPITTMAQLDVPLLRQARELIEMFLALPEQEDNPVPLQDRIASGAAVQSLRRYVPVGVVAAISAYNFPFFLNLWKVLPALIAGNTVILRPSPLTPLSALVFGEAAAAAGLPAGVLNVVAETGADGARLLTTHPSVDMVTFTGSTTVGTQVMSQAGATIKRLQLELGGKSAQIFLPDRLDAAAAAAAGVCMVHAGQGCVLGTRIFVPSERKAQLLEEIAAPMRRIVVGDPADPATQMGPVINAAQRERCERFVALAVASGARVVTGGKRPQGLPNGYYFEPTLLDLPDNKGPAAQEEIFGPVVGVLGYDSIDHAVEMANDTPLGLSGYVFGRDLKVAIGVARRIRAGTVNVNASMFSTFASIGGVKMSGLGRERGIEGMRIYQNIQTLNFAS